MASENASSWHTRPVPAPTYTIRGHGYDRGLPHVMIEVRNDLLRTIKDIAAWTERLTEALGESGDAIGLSPVQAVAWKQGA